MFSILFVLSILFAKVNYIPACIKENDIEEKQNDTNMLRLNTATRVPPELTVAQTNKTHRDIINRN